MPCPKIISLNAVSFSLDAYSTTCSISVCVKSDPFFSLATIIAFLTSLILLDVTVVIPNNSKSAIAAVPKFIFLIDSSIVLVTTTLIVLSIYSGP